MKTFNQLVDASVISEKQKIFGVNLVIKIQNENWKAYECSVTRRDLLFFCDKGTINYLVDSYGDMHVAVLHNWDRDHI